MSCEQQTPTTHARGIDVSRWQGAIDWRRVASAGVTHAIVKMTEGGTYTDPRFATNFAGMLAHGLTAGVYHYFRALSSTPGEQLANIRQRLCEANFEVGKHILAIDVETSRNETASPDQMADALHELVTLLSVQVLDGAHPYTPHPASGLTAWRGESTISACARCGSPTGMPSSRRCPKPGVATARAGAGGNTAAKARSMAFKVPWILIGSSAEGFSQPNARAG